MNQTQSTTPEPSQHNAYSPASPSRPKQTPEEIAEEAHRIHRLQRMLHMVMHVLEHDQSLPVERASALVADARRAALAMFPDKAQTFDMLHWPRLQRLMRQRYRMQ